LFCSANGYISDERLIFPCKVLGLTHELNARLGLEEFTLCHELAVAHQ
jgi:hypothetical protein